MDTYVKAKTLFLIKMKWTFRDIFIHLYTIKTKKYKQSF